MRSAVGISAGAAGVCGALFTTDDTGSESVEYRTIPADLGTHTDLGDLALSAIGLMTTQVPNQRIEPDAIAVAYRTEYQAAALRSAAKNQRRPIRLVPEIVATLTYLQSTGLVEQYGSVVLADLGASGLTVTVLDPASSTVEVRDRTSAVNGGVTASEPADWIGSRVADFVVAAAGRARNKPEAVVLVGGGGNVPEVGAALEARFDGVTIVIDEPQAATAKGAALLAGSDSRQEFPVIAGSGRRASAVVLGAFVVGSLLLGYGVTQVIPNSTSDYSPAGNLVETTNPTTEQPAAGPVEGTPSAGPASAPTLPVPVIQVPTYTYPTQSPTTTEPTPTTTPEPTPPTTPEPAPPTTTTLPWIPPQWPELPAWLPSLVPDTRLANDDQQAQQTELAPPAVGSAVSLEPGSPKPEVPDPLPR
ncbi:exopolyphosphatase [Rhodococcus spongiicola]|uniref:Exopolyphosphatase n=1 Tax=Rhodococcus spongiicola TaxID=2487352 RepID=A0A3S3ACP5_9NOCA|nr:exopolyphosphatase [Rhodococcus spongiicola]RVW04955.1 exopolyphosphatase [Rhodococcus spongiicola]